MKVPTLSALLSERERKMIRFECDYAEGMHPRILERLVETNMEQTAGYGEDSHCERAAALIKQISTELEQAGHHSIYSIHISVYICQKESISQWHENRKQQRNKYQGLPF